MPVKVTVVGLLFALLVTVRVPVAGPTAVGLKVTVISHRRRTAIDAGQVDVVVNGAPLVVTEVTMSGPGPSFTSWIRWLRTWPMRRVPKSTDAGAEAVGPVTTGA